MARSTVVAVALSGIQTMVGFGSLMIAVHRGIWSLGLLLTIGMACGLLASLAVLPVVLRLIARRTAQTAEARPIGDHARRIPPAGPVAPRPSAR